VHSANQVFHALSDPTRRAIFERLARRETSVKDLVGRLDVSQPAVSQHLRVLRKAGLARERRQGRYAYYRAEAAGLLPLVHWLEHCQAFWLERLAKLKTLIEEMEE
jgi:DNA-binding transcriptional ArsR family regulator